MTRLTLPQALSDKAGMRRRRIWVLTVALLLCAGAREVILSRAAGGSAVLAAQGGATSGPGSGPEASGEQGGATSGPGSGSEPTVPQFSASDSCTSAIHGGSVEVTIYGGEQAACEEWDRVRSASGNFWQTIPGPTESSDWSLVCSMRGRSELIEVRYFDGQPEDADGICAELTSAGRTAVAGPGVEREHERERRRAQEATQREEAEAREHAQNDREAEAQARKQAAEQRKLEAQQEREARAVQEQADRETRRGEQEVREGEARAREQEVREAGG